jgi:lysophospholipase L1-like esterase
MMITLENSWLNEGDKLVCFGDSITYKTDGYVAHLTEKLSKKNITVINSGIGGDKTVNALARIKEDVIKHKPTAVSIFFGTNDACVGRGQWADEPRVEPIAYKTNLIWIMQLLKLSGITKWSITPPLYRPEGEVYAKFGDVFLPYRQLAREAAEEMAARFVSADIVFSKHWNGDNGYPDLNMTTDGIHLTDTANKLLANTMLDSWAFNI